MLRFPEFSIIMWLEINVHIDEIMIEYSLVFPEICSTIIVTPGYSMCMKHTSVLARLMLAPALTSMSTISAWPSWLAM